MAKYRKNWDKLWEKYHADVALVGNDSEFKTRMCVCFVVMLITIGVFVIDVLEACRRHIHPDNKDTILECYLLDKTSQYEKVLSAARGDKKDSFVCGR